MAPAGAAILSGVLQAAPLAPRMPQEDAGETASRLSRSFAVFRIANRVEHCPGSSVDNIPGVQTVN